MLLPVLQFCVDVGLVLGLFYHISQQGFTDKQRDKSMSEVLDEVAKLKASVEAEKARVTAHEAHDADVAAGLQKQIDDLKSANGDADVIAALEAIKTDVDSFDPDVPVVPPAS